MKTPNLGQHPGYSGTFTTDQADGAFPNGTRIAKRNSEPADGHQDGDTGTILGSVMMPPDAPMPPFMRDLGIKYLYFIEWDDMPRVAVGSVDFKVRAA